MAWVKTDQDRTVKGKTVIKNLQNQSDNTEKSIHGDNIDCVWCTICDRSVI